MRTLLSLLVIYAVAVLPSLAPPARMAAAERPAPGPLQKELNDLDIAEHWIYDDLPRAFAEAKKSGKPILVVFRCVPCPPGGALDKEVMHKNEELLKAQQDFVCVRIVQTKGLDLTLFQFDYDQSWCAMFLNADGTVYGRYGTRDAPRGPQADAYLSVASFRKAMQRALVLHKNYPENKEALKGKIGKAAEYRVPEEIPGLQDRAKVETTRRNCIHCHMIHENILRTKWKDRKLTAKDLYVYPLPQAVGMTMDVDDGLRVKSVAADSPAAKAGIQAGDELAEMRGQRLISIADIQWVLHNAANDDRIPVLLSRGRKSLETTLAVSGNWKESDLGWRATSWLGLRHGLKLDPLNERERKERKIADNELALKVVGMYGDGVAPLTRAGLKTNDVIVAVNGKNNPMTEMQFLIALRLQYGPGDKVEVTVLRGNERKELTIPMW